MSNSNRSLMFISAPYTHSDPMVAINRLKLTAKYCMALKQNRITAINPTLYGLTLLDYSLVKEGTQFDNWDNVCFDILSKCDTMRVLMLDGWERSRGVIAEIEWASSHNIPMQFISQFQIEAL